MIDEHYRELARLDLGYWWFLVRHRVALRLMRRALGRNPQSVLDIGAGAGGFLKTLVDSNVVPRGNALALEPSPEAQTVLRERGLQILDATLDQLARVPIDSFPEVVTFLDVLEHLDEPVPTLRAAADRMPKAGALVVLVPALPTLWSKWDDLLAHKRRYTKRTLRAHIEAGGFEILEMRYCFFGITGPAWYRARYGMASADAGQFARVPPSVNRFLTAFFDLEARFPWWPFGTTLAAVARPRPT